MLTKRKIKKNNYGGGNKPIFEENYDGSNVAFEEIWEKITLKELIKLRDIADFYGLKLKLYRQFIEKNE